MTKQTIRLFWRSAWRYPRYVLGLLVGLPLTVLFHQFLPALIVANVLSRLSTHEFIPGDIWGSFGSALIVYAVVFFMGNVVLWRLMIILLWKLEGLVTKDIAQQVFRHLMKMSANFHANRFGGSIVSQANKLTGAYMRFVDTTIFQTYSLVLSIIFTVVILLPRSPLYVLALGFFVIVYLMVALSTTKHIRKLNAEEAAMQNKQTGYLADSITNVLAIKSFATDDREFNRFKSITEDTQAASLRNMKATIRRDAMFSSVGFSSGFMALLVAITSVLIFHADIATVFLIFSYTSNVTHGLWDFSTSGLRQYNRAFGDAADMVEILAIQPEVKDIPNVKPAKIHEGAIEFNHVKFTHPGAGETLFNDLDLKIKPGEKVGLVGHSGSGKTTLTKLLLRFVDIDAGKILIDGQNIAELAQNDLRDHIAYVPQEPLLFHRSIRENIAYGRPEASEAEIVEAAKKAHAADFIAKLPQGYDTLVGERGVKLSGGQRQRIAIARAILKDAPVLVLDEATSALDSDSERLIQAALWELMQNRTAIVVAHRLSTIQRMDRIVVLEDGNMIEQGSHQTLIAKGGVYAQLWAHQSGGFIEE